MSYCSDPQDTCSYLRGWQRVCTHLFQSQHSSQLPHAGYVGVGEAQEWEQCVCLGAKPRKTISGTLEMGNTELGARAGTQDLEITKTQNCAVIPVGNYIFLFPFSICQILLLAPSAVQPQLRLCWWWRAHSQGHFHPTSGGDSHTTPFVVHLETYADPVSFWCWKLNYNIIIHKVKNCLGYLFQCFP